MNVEIPVMTRKIDLTGYEKIVTLPEFRRMNNIQQVPLAEFLYPGCRHSRAEHSYGTFFYTSIICDNLDLDEDTKHAIKIYSLLHDVGHPPYSHVTENLLKEFGTNHNMVSERKIAKMENIIGKRFFDIISRLKTTGQSKIVDSLVGADKLDYVTRDSHHCGLKLFGDVEKIAESAVFQDGKYGIKYSSANEITNFLKSWWSTHKMIYLHKDVEIPRSMFQRALLYAIESGEIDIDKIFDMDDYDLIGSLRSSKNNSVKKLMEYLRNGCFYEPVLTLKLDGYEKYEDPDIFTIGMTNEERSNICSSLKTAVEKEKVIAEKFGIPDDSLIITISDDIGRMDPRKKEVLIHMNGRFISATELYNDFFDYLEGEMKRHYAIRLLVDPEFKKKINRKIPKYPKRMFFE